ncbi:MAG: hypothetical protein PW789_11440 [Edaphobacter sp.]|uniref:hypothetical protein n=1 Tax=Edaphobacter sp. TaxID=1934404 RepID=UPI0023961F5E|nr:hypothetical protein [Edaphobacter sp.]MDE1177198.1 hypothetical protein [Edaphobacter sp.]
MQQNSLRNMIRTILPVASLTVMSITLSAQTTATPQAPDPAMTPGTTQGGSLPKATSDTGASPQQKQTAAQVQATSLEAEFTKNIDTKKAKAGDEVDAKTTADAKLPDGNAIPKGTRLVGNVVEVTPKSKEQKNSHLVISLNRAVTKDGKDMPIRAAVTSVTGPAMAQSMDMPSPGGGMAPSAGGGGGSSAGASGGGASSAPSSQPMPTATGSTEASAQQGAMLKSAQDRVPVGNMPNVMLSAPTTPESAGVLDAQNQNISISNGTKFTVNVSPAQAGQGGQ